VLADYEPAEFAAALVDALRDRAALRTMGERARRVMVEQWDWRIRGSQIAALVERR